MRIARGNVTTMDQLDQWLDTTRKFKLDITLDDVSIDIIFDELCTNRAKTLYTRGGEHCERGRARSLNDLAIVYKYYNPEKSYREVIRDIAEFYSKKCKEGALLKDMSYCPNIRKYNFRLHWYLGNNRHWYERFLDMAKTDFENLYSNLSRKELNEFFEGLKPIWDKE